jgi:mercuric ion binding protein
MRHSMAALLVAGMAAIPLSAVAVRPQTATLDVQNMTCALCPVTVKKSLEKVPGVRQVRIDYAQKTATVSFDADQTSASALVKATTDAGYPSTVRK